jgi:hypothetical protein
MTEQAVSIALDLSFEEAWALAQFLKRVGYSDYRRLATSNDEAYLMQYGGEKLREALAQAGAAPR